MGLGCNQFSSALIIAKWLLEFGIEFKRESLKRIFMRGFHFKNKKWVVDNVPLSKIAEKVGTPAYVYSLSAFEDRFKEVDQAYKSVPHLVAYSIKTNDNLSVINALAK